MNNIKYYVSKAYHLKGYLCLRIAGASVGVIALVWWCVLYPELCFPQDTYEVVYETKEAEGIEDATEESVTYPSILQADDEQIVVKSRLLEWLRQKKD